MGVFAGPDVIEDGLVLALDPTNTKSYSGTGDTIIDVSNNIGSISKSSGLAFAGSESQKYFDYDYNVNTDSITVPHNSVLNYDYQNWSYNLWIYRESADQSGWQQIFIKGSGNNRRPGVWFYSNDTTALHLTWNVQGSGQQSISKTAFDIPIGEWFNIVVQARAGTLMSFLNAVKDTNTFSISDRAANSTDLTIGANSTTGYVSANMRLGYFSAYNTSLTDDQIVKNYNALKARFGL